MEELSPLYTVPEPKKVRVRNESVVLPSELGERGQQVAARRLPMPQTFLPDSGAIHGGQLPPAVWASETSETASPW